PGPDESQGHAGQRDQRPPPVPGARAARVEVRRGQGRQGAVRPRPHGGEGGREIVVRVVERVCIALMVVLVADVFLGVWSRYVMRATFQWYDEVARLCFVWMIFLGAAVAVRRGAHFRLHLLIDRFGATARRRIDVLVTLIVIAFAAVLVAGGV